MSAIITPVTDRPGPSTPSKKGRGSKSNQETAKSAILVTPVATKVKPIRAPKLQPNKDVLTAIEEESDENQNKTNIIDDISEEKLKILNKEETFKVERTYKIVGEMSRTLGGEGSFGSTYGEIRVGAVQKVFDVMREKCGFNEFSRMVDIGAGLGKPNFHAAQSPQVRLSLGIEVEKIRWQLSMHNLHKFANHIGDYTTEVRAEGEGKKNAKLSGGVNFVCSDIDLAKSMDPFTHVYMFDLAMPPVLMKSMAGKFNNSVHPVCLVSFCKPKEVMDEYGFAVEFVDQVMCTMFGSGEGHTAYIYRRVNVAPRLPKVANQRVLSIPGRPLFKDEKNEEVYCDEVWYDAARLAVGPVADLRDHVKEVVNAHLSETRSQRERKPRVINDDFKPLGRKGK